MLYVGMLMISNLTVCIQLTQYWELNTGKANKLLVLRFQYPHCVCMCACVWRFPYSKV